jgi:DNA-binding beta-propeller fold protein YncE
MKALHVGWLLLATLAGFHVTKTIPVGGDGGWDYVTLDPDAHRLYITRGDHISVLDTKTDTIVGEVKGLSGVHGVALVPKLGRGFISNGRSNTATLFDLKKLTSIGEVKTGTKPDAIVFDAPSGRVFTMNGGSSDATAIDAAKGEVVGTVALEGQPEFAVSDGKGLVFVNLEDKAEIVAFDARSLKVVSRWKLPQCEAPTGLAIDLKKRRLFSGCHSRVMDILDADKGTLISTVPIGAGVDATAFDPSTGLAFSSNGDGTLTVVKEESPGKFAVLETVTTLRGARTMALDTREQKIYLPTAKFEPAKEGERPRPIPGTFVILVVAR